MLYTVYIQTVEQNIVDSYRTIETFQAMYVDCTA